jgi:hypothetical protein
VLAAPLSPWSTESASREDADILSRIKFLDFEAVPGDILFVPAYWWYSISFSGDQDTTVAVVSYDAAMNVLAQSKHWALYYLQQSNIKTKPARPLVAEIPPEPPIPSKTEPPILEDPPKKREIMTNAGTYVVSDQID